MRRRLVEGHQALNQQLVRENLREPETLRTANSSLRGKQMHIDRLKREALKKPPAPESLSDTHMSKDDTRKQCNQQSEGWSEPAATSAPVQDEAVQAVLGMNQKHILPCPRFLVFSASSLPQSFSLLPTYVNSFCFHSIVRARESLTL